MMTFLLIIYIIIAFILTIYGLNAHVFVYLFQRHMSARRGQDRRDPDRRDIDRFYREQGLHALPVVTSQIPIYNELNVAERIIDAVAAFEYPSGKHEIQVLDDSTDETTQIILHKVQALQKQGIWIEHLRRPDRQGFKAGALAYGLECMRGEMVTIFDADFVPPRNFLLETIPFFLLDSTLGFLQTRWGHLNRDENLLTRLQALALDAQFVVEQPARSWNHLFVGFHGTSGVLRKQAIVEAGNWQADTLTEDIDLAYRIQLAGWKGRALLNCVSPAELPSDLTALKIQQFRWVKGTTQTALKILPSIWRSAAPLGKKCQATLFLTHHVPNLLMVLLVLISPVLFFPRGSTPPTALFGVLGGIMFLGFIGPLRLYITAQHYLSRSWRRQMLLFPLVFCLGGGLAVNNTKALLEVVLRKKSAFIRTPKQGEKPRIQYLVRQNPLFLPEIMLSAWNLWGAYYYLRDHQYVMSYMFFLYAIGTVLFMGEALFRRRNQRPFQTKRQHA